MPSLPEFVPRGTFLGRQLFDGKAAGELPTSSGVHSKTEDFLALLLWSVDTLGRPTFRNLTDSYDGWAYRNGLLRQVAVLERKQFLERDRGVPNDRLYRLTSQGRLCALGGRDPPALWSREWDGRWRLVVFDIPSTRNTHRTRLRRYLRNKGFGCLQDSVWITPDSLEREHEILARGPTRVKSLILLEARPCAGESDAEIVSGAWDFVAVNSCYSRHLKVLDQRPRAALRNEATANALLSWATVERAAWLQAVTRDPLLPQRILPPDYLGQRAWRRRVEVLRQAGRQLPSFHQ